MQFVYILQSSIDKSLYIGCTSNTEQRLIQHNEGLVQSTKLKRPWKIIYFEAYENLDSAFERESKLKQFGSSYTGLLKRLGLK